MDRNGSSTFVTSNRRFTLKISNDIYDKLVSISIGHFPNETGGILIGYYSDDSSTAHITEISSPPPDSVYMRTEFYRGTVGLFDLLLSSWKKYKRQYYLGEWHFHPNGEPYPSNVDKMQLRQIMSSRDYKTPEPIMLIIGGNHKSIKIRCYVFVKSRMMEMKRE